MSTSLVLLLSAGLAHGAGPAVALDRLSALSAPPTIQLSPADTSAAEEVPITAPWRLVYTAGGVRTWEVAIPIRPRTLFFHRAPGDMKVLREGKSLKIAAGSSGLVKEDTWAYGTHALQVRRPIADGPPAPGEYTVRYSSATKLEDKLRYTDGDDPESFVFQSLQLDDATRSGLLLPAPAEISFTVSVPDGGAVLDLTPALLPPELGDPAVKSDGARLTVYVNDERLVSWRLAEGLSDRRRVRLADWSGETVTLTLKTEPGPAGDASLDYVFVADPVVFVPTMAPPRVVVIFIDTLRADHLSLYGYERETTPKISRWAEDAAVFEQARSIAPWTLPSAQTMLTGQFPEQWDEAQTIQEALSAEGWATTFIAGNIYLSSNFGMSRGWAEHRCINWPVAGVQVERATDYLRQNSDRPVFMMLHFMDMHLPYTEPPWYRNTFAGDAPEELPRYQFDLGDVKKAARTMGPEGKQYVRDRYDNNLRYIDDQLAGFLGQLREDDTVLIIADHGEEFWDHGGFEHGHTLYDELLRVPMIAKGPTFSAGRFEEPTSLLDVAPSVAEAAGVSLGGAVGLPLQSLASREAAADFAARPQAFGRPLYGDRRWGSLHGGLKYTSSDGTEQVFDLGADPEERDNIAPKHMAEGRAALGEAMHTEAPILFRLTASRSSGESKDVTAVLTVPGGIDQAWIGGDFLKKSASRVTRLGPDRFELVWEGRQRSTREIYVKPTLPAEEAIQQASLVMVFDGEETPAEQLLRSWPPVFRARNPTILRASSGSRKVSLSFGVAPVPAEQGPDQRDDCEKLAAEVGEEEQFVERCPELVALGYMDPEGCEERADALTELQAQLKADCR